MKEIKENLNYKLGYSNFSFDLWIILHKKQQIGPVSDRKNYVRGINDAYNEKFQYIDDYKEERNFKKILSLIELEDVVRAVKNGNAIRQNNEQNSEERCRIYGKFKYYIENPDMTINECVQKILQECGAME